MEDGRMRNMNVGVKVARKVRTAEHAIDQAMIEVCKLIQTALEGRLGAADAGSARLGGCTSAEYVRARRAVRAAAICSAKRPFFT